MDFKAVQGLDTLTFELYIDINKVEYVDMNDIYEIYDPERINKLLSFFAGDRAINTLNRIDPIVNKLSAVEMEVSKMKKKQSEDKVASDSRIVELLRSVQQLTKEVKDIKMQMTEEKKNDGNDDLRQQMQLLQKSMSLLMNQSMNNKKEVQKESAMERWLKNIVQLPQYIELFHENGLEDLSTVKHLTTKELDMIGVDKIGHKLRILKEIEKLNNPPNTHILKPQRSEGNVAYYN